MTRPEEITLRYINLIDEHLTNLVLNVTDQMLEIEDFAKLLFIHPTHLANTIKGMTGTSACGIYQLKIIERALRLLADASLPIKDIAYMLTYEPSQFTKWFKRITKLTPGQYRSQINKGDETMINTEMMTILKKHADIPLCF
jgi:AraC-like DNA-binding protein